MIAHDLARIAAVLFGLVCVGLVFRSIIVNAFLTQLRRDLVSRSAWGLTEGVFRLFVSKRAPPPRIDRAMAWFWPVVQFVMIYLWYLLVIAGFAAINWGVGASPTFRQAVVASGSAASTLGFSTPSNLPGEIVAIVEGGIGLFLVVFLLTFIPGYLTAQQSRSDQTSRVYARAGSPPTGAALVEWYYRSGKGGDLDNSCATWETWVRDFGLAHSQSPALGLTRAHRSSEYWVSAVAAMMDAAAIAKDVLDVPEASAPFFLAAAEHALQDVARVLRAPMLPVPPPSRAAFESMCERLRDAGAPVKANRQAAWQAFSQTQAAYAEVLAGLADRAMVGPALWRLSGRGAAGDAH